MYSIPPISRKGMEESEQGEGELRRRNVDTKRGQEERTTDTREQQEEQVEVKEKVVDSEAEDRAVVGEEIAKSIGQDKPPEVRRNFSGCNAV